MRIHSVREVKLRGKRAIIRADFDVSMRGRGIADDFRIHKVIPTIRLLIQQGLRVRLVSHLGRPGGKRLMRFSMHTIARYLERAIGKRVLFLTNPLDSRTFTRYNKSSHIIFFENIRFFPGEESGNLSFAESLARWGDIYINEAFANIHRTHASMVALPRLLPAYAGLHFEAELKNLTRLLHNPLRPFVALLGGAKLETKIPLIKRFLRDADYVLVGGALANTLWLWQGIEIGRSLVDRNRKGVDVSRIITHKKLRLPADVVVSPSSHTSRRIVRKVGDMGIHEVIHDIGPQGIKEFTAVIRTARTIVWNGPLGHAEVDAYAEGTLALARAIRRSGSFSVVGGGDTIAILSKHRLLSRFSHISTGGGAMLEYLAGKRLLALETLEDHS